jgi:tetratricopeptide (TPR) repeat protein
MMLADLCKETGDVGGALDALCEILVILPDEEERIGKKIEEIKEGALSEISLRAQKMRKALEQTSEEVEADREEQLREVTAEINVKEIEKKAAAQAAIKEKAAPKKPFNRREADAAFDLGMVYHKTGLADEARAEFEKAKNIYDIFIEDGGGDPIVLARIEQIKGILG